ncbi:hypothetical protein RclHR1_10010007 [Rhizophagus clarus]|uniref:Uncharacterized protein n=1 Tax=Rhizophagus clarus TaxID=94130 RepID=A0A2Z6QEK3_9GLOM|nr:hypothetical protein RclHR1_10010007 [Rhizophagus clarus]
MMKKNGRDPNLPPLLPKKDTHSIDTDTIHKMITDKKNNITGITYTDYFKLAARKWRENDTYFTKKTKEPIKNFRLQIVVSKKNVSKLAVVRARIRRRIRESARFALPVVGRERHDYLFFANLKSYDAPWLQLCSAVESAIGNPKLYSIGKSHGGGSGYVDKYAPKKGQKNLKIKLKNNIKQL